MKRQRSCKRFYTKVVGLSLTKQSFKAQCDVNTILRKAEQTGFVSHLNAKDPLYRDCTTVPDYQVALDIVRKAQDGFINLPSSVRRRFENDPAKLLDFLSLEENREEGVRLGLLSPAKAVAKVVEKVKEAAEKSVVKKGSDVVK